MHAVLAQGEANPTHADLGALTGWTERTILRVVQKARPEGFLEGERPVRLGTGLGMALGVSLGSETLRAGLVDANGEIRVSAADSLYPGQLESSPTELLPRIRSIAARVLESAFEQGDLTPPGSPQLRLVGVATAWPAPVDRGKQLKGKAFKDPNWYRAGNRSRVVPTLEERVSESLGGPFSPDRCHALNDLSAHALAVVFDNTRKRAGDPDDEHSKLSLVVRVGGGLGSGIMVVAPHRRKRLSFIDSKLIEGTGGLAGEIGHLPVGRRLIEEVSKASSDLTPMDYETWKCSCGERHHLEAFASGMGLLRRLRESDYDFPDNSEGHEALLASIAAGKIDDELRSALVAMGRIVGRAMAGPILILDPDSITVTGSLACQELVSGMYRERDMWASVIDDSVEIDPRGGEQGAWAGVRGAGLAVLRRAVYREFLDRKLARPKTFSVSRKEVSRLARGH